MMPITHFEETSPMLEILKFVLGSPWTFLGFAILLGIVGWSVRGVATGLMSTTYNMYKMITLSPEEVADLMNKIEGEKKPEVKVEKPKQ